MTSYQLKESGEAFCEYDIIKQAKIPFIFMLL